MFIVIPAYRPDEKLFGVIDGLASGDDRFIVVDDGSGAAYAGIFRRLEKEYSGVTVIRHCLNRGKGRALKTAFEYISGICREDDGILTIDADGQHLTRDALTVMSAWKNDPDAFIIGSRHFSGHVPFRSRWGNAITRSVFAVTSGVRVYDTQSGLRAFSVKRIKDFLEIKGERYDYEIAELLFAAKQHIKIIEAPINTVYIAGNRSSHFRLFKDSWIIYKMIFLFMLSSFSCFLIDYSLLLILASVFKSLPQAVETAPGMFALPVFGLMADTHLVALIIARAVSSFVNFLLNMRVVFKTSNRTALIRFYTVIIGMLIANYGLLALVADSKGMPLWIAQLVVQAVLYPFSFILQRKFVFPDRGAKAAAPAGNEGK